MDLGQKATLQQAFDYYDAVVDSDINRADGVNKNPERVRQIMRSFARNQGTGVASTIMANETEKMNEDTVHSYIDISKKIFVVGTCLHGILIYARSPLYER